MSNVIPMSLAKFYWIYLLASNLDQNQCVRMQCKKVESLNNNDIVAIMNFFKSKFSDKVEISHRTFKKPPTLIIMIENLNADDQAKLSKLMTEIEKN